MIKFKSLVIQLIFFGVLLGASQVSFAQDCEASYRTNVNCAQLMSDFVGDSYCKPAGIEGFSFFCRGKPYSSSSSSASSVPPPSDCAPHLAKNSEGFCVCPNEGTQVDMNGSCQSTCPAGHDNSGMCYPEDCPWGEGTPAQCNDRTCSNEGHKSVEMLPGMWMCVKEIPDDDSGSSSSTGGGDDNNGGGDGDGGSGQSSSAASGSCQNGEQWNGTQCVQPKQCPAGTAWGNVGGFWDCWSGWPDNNNGDCPEGQTWGSVNGIQGCWGQSGNCPPGQSYGVVNGVLGCHGQPIQSCPNGQIWGSVNGVQGCYGAPSCPAGFTHGTVNGVTTCWNNSGCDAVGNCSNSSASSTPNCPNGQVWNGAQCQLPTSSSASSGGSGDGDGDGNNSSDGSGNGGGSGSSASSAASSSCPEGQECSGGGTGEWPEPGGFCEEGEECNSLTMEGVLGDFMEGITSAEIISSMDEFLTIDGGGSCPVWNVSAWIFTLTIDQFCSPHIPWALIRGVILFVASVIAFRIAFT